MTDEILSIIVNSEINSDQNFPEWLAQFFMREDIRKKCSIEEFAVGFLNLVRSQTERFVRGNTSSSCDTPRKHLNSTNESKNLALPLTATIPAAAATRASASTPNTNNTNTTNTKFSLSSGAAVAIALHKKFETQSTTQSQHSTPGKSTAANSVEKKSLVKKSISLTTIDNGINSSYNSSTPKSSKNQRITPTLLEDNSICNSTIEIGGASRFEIENVFLSGDNSHSQCIRPTTIRSRHQSSVIPSRKHDVANNSKEYNSLDSSSFNLTTDASVVADKNTSELALNDFPSLGKSFKSNTSTPTRKFNKSGAGVERNTNTHSPFSNANATNSYNYGNGGRSGRSSRQSNPSTPVSGGNEMDYRTPQTSSLCLGDFLSTPTSHKSKSQNKKNQKASHNTVSSQSPKSHMQNDSKIDRPKPRRVIPTPVLSNSTSNAVSSFTSPAFRTNEGNILNISSEEIVDRNHCSIQIERAKLKSQMQDIAKEFAEVDCDSPGIRHNRIQSFSNDIRYSESFQTPKKQQSTEQSDVSKMSPSTFARSQNTPVKHLSSSEELSAIVTSKIDFTHISHKPLLNRFVDIHSTLLESNLVTNILNEFSYFINFFNIDLQDFLGFVEVSSIAKENFGCRNAQTSSIQEPQNEPQTEEISSTAFNSTELIQETLMTTNHRIHLQKTNDDSTNDVALTTLTENTNPSNAIEIPTAINRRIALVSAMETQHNLSTSSSSTIDPNLINRTADSTIVFETVLKNFINCLYYALEILKKQRNNLALLDTKSLRVILDNELLKILGGDLLEYLQQIYAVKMEIENSKPLLELSSKIDTCGKFQNVSYQPDSDTRNNFTSSKECDAFKNQRDLFYVILRTWEAKHLGSQWNFETYLGSKIQALLAMSDNPINMTHLAKLFTSQLIISLNFTEPLTDLDMDLCNIDMKKLSKLRQRLVAPGHFSQDYQFPGNQQFFKEFLMVAQSVVFIEQLKVIIISELLELNNSTYETIDLTGNMENEDLNCTDMLNRSCNDEHSNDLDVFKSAEQERQRQKHQYHEYVVRPEIISTMRVLGKFLGLLISRPYRYEGCQNSMVDNKQIELRNLLKPEFDVMHILKKSIIDRKLIITLPWVIEYISMLDDITLKLNYYRTMMNYLYELYTRLTSNGTEMYYGSVCKRSELPNLRYQKDAHELDATKGLTNIEIDLQSMRPTSIFILKICLGWLFEQFNATDDYFSYRREIFLPAAPVRRPNSIECQPNMLPYNKAFKKKIEASQSINSAFDPLLENILNVSCPFLADFRISIMPTKLSKSLSRTGRLRHITTKILPDAKSATTSTTQFSSPHSSITSAYHQLGANPGAKNANESAFNLKSEKDSQTKLIEAFLHSQSLSVRRIVEFVIERTTSAVIKDFQMEVILKSKTEANQKVEKISSFNLQTVINAMTEIYNQSLQQVVEQWESSMENMIRLRVEKALDALLPNETLPIVNKTCALIIAQKCKLKTDLWRQSNLNICNFYSKDIDSDAEKFVKNYTSTKTELSTALEINNRISPPPSEVLNQLQFCLHFTIKHPEILNVTELHSLINQLEQTLKGHTLPSSFYRICGAATVILLQNLILMKIEILDAALIQKLIDIWNIDSMQEFAKVKESVKETTRNETEINGEELEKSESSGSTKLNEINVTCVIFDSLLSACFIKPLCGSESKHSIEKFSDIIIRLIVSNLLTVSYLNNRFVSLFKNEWSSKEYKNLTTILERISGDAQIKAITSTLNENKSNLFMEMLSDLLRDIDDY